MVGKTYRHVKQLEIISITEGIPEWVIHYILDTVFWEGIRSNDDKIVTYTSTWKDIEFTVVAKDTSPPWEILN